MRTTKKVLNNNYNKKKAYWHKFVFVKFYKFRRGEQKKSIWHDLLIIKQKSMHK